MATVYFEGPGSLFGTADGDADVPVGATVVAEAVYDASIAAIASAEEGRRVARNSANQADALSDYNALITAGVPVANAERLSGYRP